MKKLLVSGAAASLVLLAGVGNVSAQDGDFKVIPVELYACTYNDGKGPDDLDNVIDQWSAWADKQGLDDYAGWTLTPYYFGPEQEFDVIWLGAGKDAVALGKAEDAYLNNDAGLLEAFSEVLSCNAHANFASINYKLPPGATPKGTSIMTFSDCTFKDGATFAKLGTAMGEWSQHLSDTGSKAGVWNWYPVYGGGGEEFDFKWFESHKNLAALGADYEVFGNGKGFVKYRNTLSHLISCDSTRAYIAENRRYVKLR